MSTLSGMSSDFDFWEFVCCGLCHLDFVKESGTLSSVPFWLTNCGHVVCNSHLNADQSCTVCGTANIQLIPLQQELEPPMADWFSSLPTAFDTIAYSMRYQMNSMATLVRHFKKKYLQYRPLYERLRDERAETKRLTELVDELKQENKRLRQLLQANCSEGAVQVNANGKRPRTDDDGGHHTSSPRSATASLGPDRLTLPPGHHQPQFNSRQSHQPPGTATVKQNLGSYAYVPPRSVQAQTMVIPNLSHAQLGTVRHTQAREGDNLRHAAAVMPPPPLPASRLEHRASVDIRTKMPPPPTPLQGSGNRLLPQRPSFVPATPQLPSSCASQRFVPPTPSKAGAAAQTAVPRTFIPGPHYGQQQQSQRFIPSGSVQRLLPSATSSSSGSLGGSLAQTPSRTTSLSMSRTGGQRTPFVPTGDDSSIS
ncbi:hypothetical protein C8Q79DRAFT_600047 [Trametes meyenii]|nr:hypothetical protein C8Q79DRAFT_600047 [Trametes meyenii]